MEGEVMIKSEMGNSAFYALLSKKKRDDFEEGFVFRCKILESTVDGVIALTVIETTSFMLGYFEADNYFNLTGGLK